MSDKAPEEELNYFLEMIKHPANGWGLSAGLIAGCVAAIATGVAPIVLIPVVAQAGLNGILGLFLPESPVFRQLISRKKRDQRREEDRQRLTEEIAARVPGKHANWESYHRMREQLLDLRRTARRSETNFSAWDVERLDDMTVDFLRMWLARILLHERARSTDHRRVERQLAEVEYRLQDETLEFLDRTRLQKARDDLQKVLDRRKGQDLQDHSMAASMLAMADGFGEVHHQVLANPTGKDLGSFLDGHLERMRVGEELDHAADLELEQAVALSRGARKAVDSALGEALRDAEPAGERSRNKTRA